MADTVGLKREEVQPEAYPKEYLRGSFLGITGLKSPKTRLHLEIGIQSTEKRKKATPRPKTEPIEMPTSRLTSHFSQKMPDQMSTDRMNNSQKSAQSTTTSIQRT